MFYFPIDRLGCTECLPDQVTEDGMCAVCTMKGFVPNTENSDCVPCLSNQITVMGMCQNCTNPEEIPTMDRLDCTMCPIDLINEDGTCRMNISRNLFMKKDT